MAYIGLEPRYVRHHTQSFTSNGTTLSYPLAVNPGTPSSIIVYVDGVPQRPGLDYNVQLSNLVFDQAPPAPEIGVTNNIFVVYF